MAASAFAVESANTVGYHAMATAVENYNYAAAQFFSVGYTTTDINTITLDDGSAGTVGWGDSMVISGPLGNPAANYLYYDATLNPAGEEAGSFWGDEMMEPVTVSFDAAEGFAIDNSNGLEFSIVNSGEVPVNEATLAASENYTYTGNPFPASIDINDITLDDGGAGAVGWGDSMVIVGPLGNPAANYLYYDATLNSAGEEAGPFWGDEMMEPVNVTFLPGQAFAIDNSNGLEFDIRIACPYTL